MSKVEIEDMTIEQREYYTLAPALQKHSNAYSNTIQASDPAHFTHSKMHKYQ